MSEVTAIRQSRTGKRPIELAAGASVELRDSNLRVTGPKGLLVRPMPLGVDAVVEGKSLSFRPALPGRDGARMQGLMRALAAAMVKGVTEGYVRELELVGTGYRAEVRGESLSLALGFSHQVLIPLPAGVAARVPAESKGTLVILTGADKEALGQLSAKLRALRPPEPYGGKGVRFKGEKVRQKAGKSGGKK